MAQLVEKGWLKELESSSMAEGISVELEGDDGV